jgi:hypothetical protein
MIIEFPPGRYLSGMGLGSTCTATDEKGNSYSSCTVSGHKVSVGIGELSNSPRNHNYVVVIKNVTNPSTTGGVGFFKLSTWKGINLLDQNDFFATLGIADTAPKVKYFTIACTVN